MSETAEQINPEDEKPELNKEQKAEQIASLKSRLDLMGVKYHHSLGIDKLQTLVAQGLEEASRPKEEQAIAPAFEPMDIEDVIETIGARRARLRREAGTLVRIIVANMNPEKRDWDGDTYSVGNSVVGQYKKFVPFNNEQGWHVPQIVVNHMLEKQCQIWVNKKNERGQKVKVGKLINELNVQILPALSQQQLDELGRRQAMNHSIDD